LAGGALFAAVWTKYQAICLPVAVGFYLVYLACLRDKASLKRTIRPVAAMGVAGVLAVATLYAYFRFHAGLEWAELLGGITRNVNRVGAPPESFGAVLAATLAEGIHYLGDHLLVVACLAMVPGKVPSRLAALLLCFCLATILFNLWAYRMPGGGSYYLNEMAPALAVLVGRPVAVALSWPQGLKRTVLLAAVVVLLGIQWEKKRPWNLVWPLGHENRVKAVAGYLKAHTREGDWLLAQDVAP